MLRTFSISNRLLLVLCSMALAAGCAHGGRGGQGEGSGLSSAGGHESVLMMVVVSGARLRDEPALTGAQVGTLSLGSRLNVSRHTDSGDEIDGDGRWVFGTPESGLAGWVHSSLVAVVDTEASQAQAIELMNSRLSSGSLGFLDWIDLVRFCDDFIANANARTNLIEARFLRLKAINRAAEQVPSGVGAWTTEEPYSSWLETHAEDLAYSEPGDQWFVNGMNVWRLAKEAEGLTIADSIGWYAAHVPIPGECEGFLPCYLGLKRLTIGQYLQVYPTGAHVEQGLESITEMMIEIDDRFDSFELYDEGGAETLTVLDEIREIVIATKHPKSKATVASIDQVMTHLPN